MAISNKRFDNVANIVNLHPSLKAFTEFRLEVSELFQRSR